MSTTKNSSSAALQPGTRLSHYLVQERLGAGGMGTVYRARDTRLSRDVAIKVINTEIAGDAERVARFHREARAVAALNHPGIVTIHDTGEEHGTPYIVTELVDGTTLRTLLADGNGLGTRRVIEIGSQVAEALAAAHGAGITHRDVKPENIMVTRTGRVKLLDFGLARAPANDENQSPTMTAMPTESGTVLGTPAYMSPEQVRGEGLDPRTDIFSLGVVLYEMTIGGRPFGGPTPADVVSAVLRTDPPPLSASVPPALRLIIERCLGKRPDERFQSAADLRVCAHEPCGTPVRDWGGRCRRGDLTLSGVARRSAACRGHRSHWHWQLSPGEFGQSGRSRSVAAIRDRGARGKSTGLVARWAQHRLHVSG